MSTTLTIRNLDAEVKQQLRLLAASHQRSMEAEARAILAAAVGVADPARNVPLSAREAVAGLWSSEISGDELLRLTRGED